MVAVCFATFVTSTEREEGEGGAQGRDISCHTKVFQGFEFAKLWGQGYTSYLQPERRSV